MALVKVNGYLINQSIFERITHPVLNEGIIKIGKHTIKLGDIFTLDYRNRIRKNQIFNPVLFPKNKIIFISHNSFQQTNSKLNNSIRKYVLEKSKSYTDIMSIGGESYVYGLNKICKRLVFYTNSEHIINDFKKNLCFYGEQLRNIFSYKIAYNNIDDYTKHFEIPYTNICVIINLSKLNLNVINYLNKYKSFIKYIIIISCNHKDYLKKSILLDFKLHTHKNFVDYKLKSIISVYCYQNNEYILPQ
jgi:5'(3')-deoxyribonucleotidase